MSYRTQIDDGMGGVEWITVETPDEDYDRMKQEELDERMAKMHVVPRHNPDDIPTNDYPFTTLDDERRLTGKDRFWLGVITCLAAVVAIPWIVGACTIWKWMFTK